MEAAIDIYDIAPSPLPIALRVLERHPASFQTFIPLNAEALVVAVCPADAAGEPDLRRLRAFRVGPGRIVTYRRGVWHMGMTSLDGPARMAMVMYRTAGTDTEFNGLKILAGSVATAASAVTLQVGANASQRYGVVQVPVWVTSQPAVAGTMKKLRCPPVVCRPMALPRTEAGKIRDISAEAGA